MYPKFGAFQIRPTNGCGAKAGEAGPKMPGRSIRVRYIEMARAFAHGSLILLEHSLAIHWYCLSNRSWHGNVKMKSWGEMIKFEDNVELQSKCVTVRIFDFLSYVCAFITRDIVNLNSGWHHGSPDMLMLVFHSFSYLSPHLYIKLV